MFTAVTGAMFIIGVLVGILLGGLFMLWCDL